MAVTDVGVAAGGLGKTVAAAIVQFNKAAVTPRTITMVPALAGSNTVQIPVYSKMAASAVTNSASGAEETTGSAASITSANLFEFTNNNAFGVDIDNGVLTNVAYSEGDIMMLDVSGKATSDGSTVLVTFDCNE